ncbi:MAG: cell division protein SepF [Coprococcus sp.]
MAKSSAKKSFLDYFKLNDSGDDFDDDLFDEDEEDDDDDDFEEYEPKSAPAKSSPFQSHKSSYNAAASQQPAQKKNKAVKQTRNAAPVNNNKLVSINNSRSQYSSQHVYVIKPDEFDDAQMIIDHLRSGQAIVINMEGIELSTAQRIIDFIAGACYAVDGSLQAISGNIFIAAPNDIYVSGDLREEILGDSSLTSQVDRY